MNKKRKIRPIKYYINDKEELINQVFSCIPEKQIKKMTPSSLTDMSIDELKAECLVQLLKMPNKRIIRILDGLKNYRSESEELDENCKSNEAEIIKSESAEQLRRKIEKERDKDIENFNNITSESKNSFKRKHKEKKYKEKKKKRKRSNEEELNDAETKGRNLLELLELEMRAKAIRSLIKKEEELEKLTEEMTDSPLKKVPSQKEKLLKDNKITVEGKNISIKEIKDKKQRIKNDKGDTLNSIKPPCQSSSKDFKKISENKEDKNIIAGKENDEKNNSILNCDWNIDEEKLIYEDDEYDSDDKEENEISKEREKSEENSTSSWAERWLQSKDVKKVVATSKMLTVVRNKMKNNIKSSIKSSNYSNSTLPGLDLKDSVKEYNTLLQMNEAVMADAKMRAALKKEFDI